MTPVGLIGRLAVHYLICPIGVALPVANRPSPIAIPGNGRWAGVSTSIRRDRRTGCCGVVGPVPQPLWIRCAPNCNSSECTRGERPASRPERSRQLAFLTFASFVQDSGGFADLRVHRRLEYGGTFRKPCHRFEILRASPGSGIDGASRTRKASRPSVISIARSIGTSWNSWRVRLVGQ